MFTRLRRISRTPRRALTRIGVLEDQVRDLSRRLEVAETSLDSARTVEWPGFVLLTDGKIRAAADAASTFAIAVSREHAEAATAVASSVARSDAVELANFAIETARINSDAAVSAAIDSAVRAAAEHTNAAVAEERKTVVDHARTHAEALNTQSLALTKNDLAAVRRELNSFRLTRQATDQNQPATNSSSVEVGSSIDPALYVALEDRFRGESSMIADRQRIYLPLVEGLADTDHPVVDLGSGRGEWLRVLRGAGIPAIGVDTNPAFVGGADTETTVLLQDLVTYLHDAPDESVGAITMFQVVEHLPLPVLVDVLAQCLRVLRPGGILIAETPNALNLRVAATTFWLDPTHQRPLHPELLQFLATQVGFAKVDGWFVNDLGDVRPGIDDEPTGQEVRRLASMVDGPGDFALLAWR